MTAWAAPMSPWKITHIQQGLHLRDLGLSYTAIAVVLVEYHGLTDCTASRARSMLRRHGAGPQPHGGTNAMANLNRGHVA